MSPRGGTEILWSAFQKYISKTLQSKCNVIVSNTAPGLLSTNKPNILWQHVDVDQAVAKNIGNPDYYNRLSVIVFVSEWQRQKYITTFNIPQEKCIVIHNAVEPVEWVDKPSVPKLKLIYTSTPWRGLELLLESFKRLNRADIELDVYSSTVIYGKDFMPNGYRWLFDRCIATPGVNYRGYATNKAVIKALSTAHILSYPSIFAETSCLAAIEAGCAGCNLVLTEWGALPETCGSWANYVPVDGSLLDNYTKLLGYEIDNYWNNYSQCMERSKYFVDKYSWERRKYEWENLLGTL